MAQKIYTEGQVRKAMQESRYNAFRTDRSYDEILNSLTPIELPSDEEIEEESNKEYQEQEQSYENSTEFLPFNDSLYLKAGFFQGAKWLKQQILNQNK